MRHTPPPLTDRVPSYLRRRPSGLFAANLGRLMTDAGPIPAALADRLGVTPGVVHVWLRGANPPRLDLRPRIAVEVGLADARDLLPPLPLKGPES